MAKSTAKKKPATVSAFRNRIVGERIADPRELKANEKNWRTHPDAQRRALSDVMGDVGWVQRVVVNRRTGNIVDGHLRVELAIERKDKTVPVIEVDLSEQEEAKILAMLDPIGAMASKDTAKLAELLGTIAATDPLLPLIRQIAGSARTLNTDPDDIPEMVESRTKPGDLWRLGEHRLFCGDASDPRAVARVAPESWDVVVLDPPYELDAAIWSRWIWDPSIVFGQGRHLLMIPPRLWRFERVIVKRYRHRSATIQLNHQHALVVQVGSEKTLPTDKKITLESVVDQERELKHDHQKPVALIVEHLSHWTPSWKRVMDPFAGSGPTIIAAEMMGRACSAIELDPATCDIVIARWESATNKRATKA